MDLAQLSLVNYRKSTILSLVINVYIQLQKDEVYQNLQENISLNKYRISPIETKVLLDKIYSQK